MASAGPSVGAVLVVGGGVGGMQASLDLADAGYKVYLVEQAPAIGGKMAQLDKTFPTNDCAMCTLAPRLVDTGAHLNVEKITGATVDSVEGDPGHLRVAIRTKARYVDVDRCTGCSACVDRCPVRLDSEFDVGLVKRTAIYRRYPQAFPGALAIDKQGVSPCRTACPAGVNPHAYVSLIARGRFAEALAIERQGNPFPAMMGRICTHPCELDCTRGPLDGGIAIRPLKRFLADWEAADPARWTAARVERKREEKVAVVGSGPAGLSAARELALRGYPVTLLEARREAGGMLRYGIPEYRLPKQIVAREIQQAVLDLGVELRTGVRLGVDVTLADLRREHRAVVLAIGAWEEPALGVPGEDGRAGITGALPFLAAINSGEPPPVAGKKVLVVGGGNSAVDAARSALRLGADVTILYRRTREEMPAYPWEVDEALEEGVRITYLVAPSGVLGANGRATGLRCVKMRLGEPDDSGRRRPVTIAGSDFDVPADLVIAAIGLKVDPAPLAGVAVDAARRVVKVDDSTLQTSTPGVFACGDVVSGPDAAVTAIAAGRQAATSVDRYLRGEPLEPSGAAPRPPKATKDVRGVARQPRTPVPKLALAQRRSSFRELEQGYTEEQARAEAARCLSCGDCCECQLCVAACEATAIRHDMPAEETRTLDVGAVVLAPGYDLFDARLKPELGFGRHPDVLSSLQFERMLSASGPTQGRIRRPSDGRLPRNVAFIQCVGSRDVAHDYCSSVCCMVATKEAMIAKEHEPELECSIFYIDVRAFGKGFEQYFRRARDAGVKYVRCRPYAVTEAPGTGGLVVTYHGDDEGIASQQFDLVVLSCGMTPSRSSRELAATFGVQLNAHGFARTGAFRPVETSRPGVYACGPFAGPKDIPETVIEASAAAAVAMRAIADARHTLTTRRAYPPERDVAAEEPRIGVFVCHCGKNIGGVADVPAVRDYAASLPGVVHSSDHLYTCSSDTQVRIREAIREHRLNRVVVASCTPRTHESLFRSTCREAGLNPYLFEMANIRDQNTWVHMREPQQATQKAKDLVRMAVAKSRLLEPLQNRFVAVEHDALVIGGGMTGMTAALELADQGFVTHLVERAPELGGNMRRIHSCLEEDVDPQQFLASTIERVRAHPRIRLHLAATVRSVEGSIGNFRTTVEAPEGADAFRHGVVIVASGASAHVPTEYRYGEDPAVVTQLDLEGALAGAPQAGWSGPRPEELRDVVMIQCVGSREADRPYCSRICCSMAIKNALRLRKAHPAAQVYVLYRDVRTYGFNEEHYRRARELGVAFVRYDEAAKPEVERRGGKLTVTVQDRVLGRRIELPADLVVLSTAIVPDPAGVQLGKQLKVPLNQDRYFLEAHMKLRPIEFATDGMFLAGLAHSPGVIRENVAQACAAAARAATILAKDRIELDAVVSEVVDENCDGCGYCVEPCPFHALTLIEYMRRGEIKKTIDRDIAVCKGCGVCQATCPKGGIVVDNFKLPQLVAMVHAALEA